MLIGTTATYVILVGKLFAIVVARYGPLGLGFHPKCMTRFVARSVGLIAFGIWTVVLYGCLFNRRLERISWFPNPRSRLKAFAKCPGVSA